VTAPTALRGGGVAGEGARGAVVVRGAELEACAVSASRTVRTCSMITAGEGEVEGGRAHNVSMQERD